MAEIVRTAVEGIDRFVGIDHHKKTSRVAIKDRSGRVVVQKTIPTRRDAFVELLGQQAGCRWAVFEAGARSRVLWQWLSGVIEGAVVAHPSQLKIVAETAYKSDRVDALKLADLLRVGFVPESYVCSEEAWQRRQAVRQRVHLVRIRASLKNRVHAIVDQFPEALPPRPKVTDLFGATGREYLRQLELPENDRDRLDQLLETIGFLEEQIRRSDQGIAALFRGDPRVLWLRTIPGIGVFLSALILAEIDTISRFPKSRHLVSYTGLVPRRDQTGETERVGGIHKRGNDGLRWALVEAAIPATRADAGLKALYERIRSRRGPRSANIAKVAVARKLAEIVYCVLNEEREYATR